MIRVNKIKRYDMIQYIEAYERSTSGMIEYWSWSGDFIIIL